MNFRADKAEASKLRPLKLIIKECRAVIVGVFFQIYWASYYLQLPHLLDIKPYVPGFDAFRDVSIGWLKKAINKLSYKRDDGRFVK